MVAGWVSGGRSVRMVMVVTVAPSRWAGAPFTTMLMFECSGEPKNPRRWVRVALLSPMAVYRVVSNGLVCSIDL